MKKMMTLLLLILAAVLPAGADTPPVENPVGQLTIDIDQITVSVITQGDRREFIGARVTQVLNLPNGFTQSCRLDISGTQDGGSLDLSQFETFRSVWGFCGGEKRWDSGLGVGAFTGLSWSIEGEEGRPFDPRQVSALLLVRLPLPGGHFRVGGGHYGPVGGAAVAASLTIKSGPTNVIADYTFPLQRVGAQNQKGWELKAGFSTPIKRIKKKVNKTEE